MARNNDDEEYIRSEYKKLTKMSLEEQINYIKRNSIVIKPNSKETIKEINKVCIKNNNDKAGV